MRDGATHRFGCCADGRITSSKVTFCSAIASYTLRWTVVTSRYDIVLLACGSRSTSRVGLPRSESAAARLMAVGVFPTPPFWLAVATIIEGGVAGRGSVASAGLQPQQRTARLHLVLAHVVGIERLQPLLQPLGLPLLGHEIRRLGVVDDLLLDEDRRARAERQRDCVARPGVDGH